jgi:hypothetical protein
VDFWWENWPRHGYDPTDRQREAMWETFAVAWEQGVRDPQTFFDMLQTLGYEVYTTDWDEWRDWYNEI